jgi:hypothetical protein
VFKTVRRSALLEDLGQQSRIKTQSPRAGQPARLFGAELNSVPSTPDDAWPPGVCGYRPASSLALTASHREARLYNQAAERNGRPQGCPCRWVPIAARATKPSPHHSVLAAE